jgi:predicted  nucleic acid-binding Zn-ribbon protein
MSKGERWDTTDLKTISTRFRGGYIALNRQYIEELPIREIDFSDHDDKARHDRMVKLVEQMLSLHNQLGAAKTPDEETRLQRQIDATDQQIDRLVYELYGLTDKEIRIVEETTQ